jgi:hypothetical protein
MLIRFIAACRAWIKRHIVDEDPYDDESHASTRYKDAP